MIECKRCQRSTNWRYPSLYFITCSDAPEGVPCKIRLDPSSTCIAHEAMWSLHLCSVLFLRDRGDEIASSLRCIGSNDVYYMWDTQDDQSTATAVLGLATQG